jgi:hypothetical protein
MRLVRVVATVAALANRQGDHPAPLEKEEKVYDPTPRHSGAGSSVPTGCGFEPFAANLSVELLMKKEVKQ